MSSGCRALAILAVAAAALSGRTAAVVASTGGTGPAAATKALRICSDPNNMPFSNAKLEGFENKIAEVVARDLGRRVEYFWAPQRRGFVRNTLAAKQCDAMMGVPSQYALARPTRPYYRSSYVFVSKRDRHLDVRSFDDPRLARLQIAIQIVGNDYANPPAAQALAARHLVSNIHGYTVYGDYSQPNPQRSVVDAVANGTVDLAIVWGPVAGYFAAGEPVTMAVMPVVPDNDGPALAFAFDIAMAVRKDDAALHDALNRTIARRGAEIRRILRAFHVPLLGPPSETRP